MRIVLATKNEDKKMELLSLVATSNWDFVTLNDFSDMPEVIEDGDTFECNAIKKAREVSLFTGCIALADDSGLIVPALNGEPGVYSARYSGEYATYQSNIDKLLLEMKWVSSTQRQAIFVCCMALVDAENVLGLVEESCAGTILEKSSGVQGFGYDPIFYLPELGQTFAQMSAQDKNKISHRGKALRSMEQVLSEKLKDNTL